MTATRARREPDPAPAHDSATLDARVRELEERVRARRQEREQLERRSTRGLSDAQLEEREQRERLLGLQVRREEEELAAAQRELKAERAREGDAAAARFAAASAETIPTLLVDAEAAKAAADSAALALHKAVSRCFDQAVRRRLASDPTAGLRERILALCPNLNRLAALEGASLLPPRSWPKLVFDAAGGAHYEHLERIQTAADFREWCALSHQALPIGSEAARQRAELADRFGR